jgi:enamine deaminase RidA (YjgF/YER057c/UK114 family)
MEFAMPNRHHVFARYSAMALGLPLIASLPMHDAGAARKQSASKNAEPAGTPMQSRRNSRSRSGADMNHRIAIALASALFAAASPAAGAQDAATMRHVNPQALPAAHGYSHVVVAPAGRLVAISGQVALDRNGKVVGAGDFEAQCTQVFENLKAALQSVELTFADVIRTDMYVTDLKREHLSTLREVRARYLPEDAPPASTLLQVEALFRPELMIEVSVVAVIPDRAAGPADATIATP